MTTDERIKRIEDTVAAMEKDGWGMKDFSFLLALAKVQREALESVVANANEYNVADVTTAQAALNWQPEDT